MAGIIQKDCFAYHNGECRCLYNLVCAEKECTFYKHIDTVNFEDIQKSVDIYDLSHSDEEDK